MKIGIRKFYLNKRIAARISPKRHLRHNIGIKAPEGFGIFANPKKATYNRIYSRTTKSFEKVVAYFIIGIIILVLYIL